MAGSPRDIVLNAPAADMTGGVAITRYLSKTLRRGAEFKRRSNVPRPAGKNSSAKGLSIGRKSDHALHHYYSKQKKVAYADKRTARIISHIEKHLGISHVATQYPVSVDFGGHKIKTRVDMVGWKPPSKDPFGRRVGKGAYVVIELKCTQHTLDVHNRLYGLPCGAGKLSNHLPDTEKVHHQLQTAFGVLGLQERVGPKHKVIGRVVVSASDGEKSYGCDATFVRKSHFTITPVGGPPKRAPKVNCKIQLMTMPPESDDQKHVVQALASKLPGFSEVDLCTKCKVSFVARHPHTLEMAAVALLNDPENKGVSGGKYKRTRLHVIEASKKWSMIPVIMRFTSRGWVVHKLARSK